MIMNRQKIEILDKHPYKIWQGKDMFWRTYLVDNEGKRILKKKKNKDDLEDDIVQYYQNHKQNPTFREVFNDWIEEKLKFNEFCLGTYGRYKNDYIRFFNNTEFEKIRIQDLSEDDIYNFIKETIKEKHLTAKAYAGMRTLIRGVLKYAKRIKLTNISCDTFFKDIDLGKNIFVRKKKDHSKEVFTDHEVKMITHYVHENPSIRNLGILLAFQTGVRVGELSSLKRSDFDLESKTIHIQRTEINYKDKITGKACNEVRDFPKTEHSDRYIIITDKAVLTYKHIVKINPFGEYLFEDEGKRIREMAFNRRLYRICDDLKIPKRSMHKIRKTYGTTLLDNFADESLVLEQMGHKQISTTRQFYYFCNRDNSERRKQIEQAITC